MPNLWIIFLTGLLTGGLTCMAVQGGLLATMMAQRQGNEETDKKGLIRDLLAFLVSKLLAYALLGLILGWIGSMFQLSPAVMAVLMAGVSLYMIGAALNMLQVHPLFRYFVLSPPKFLTRLVRTQSKSTSRFGPSILGVMTVAIPCGTTQAMMALAMASGAPLWGMLILAVFVLGTSPLFFLLGFSVTSLKDLLKDRFALAAAISIMVMSVWNLNSALTLSGSEFTAQSIARTIHCTIAFCDDSARVDVAGVVSDHATINIHTNGYEVDNKFLKANTDVTVNLVNNDGRGCAQAFTIPKLGLSKVVPLGTTNQLTFKTPATPGKLAFTCSMGMYSGEFTIVES